MSGKLTEESYADLIKGDVEWLKSQPRTLEREHILQILSLAVEYEYGQRIAFHGSVTDLATDVAWLLDDADVEPFVEQLRTKVRTQDADPRMKAIRLEQRKKRIQ